MATHLELLLGLTGSYALAMTAFAIYSHIAVGANRRRNANSEQELAGKLQSQQRILASVQGERDQLRSDLERVAQDFEAYRLSPPMPTDAQLAGHLATLAQRLDMAISSFTNARSAIEVPLTAIIAHAEQAKVVERKQRFLEYRDALASADATLETALSQMQIALPMCRRLGDIIQEGALDDGVGGAQIAEALKTLDSFDNEYSIDRISLTRLRQRNSEYLRILEEREMLKKQSFKIEPSTRVLTAEEKFKQIRPTGSRDAFSKTP